MHRITNGATIAFTSQPERQIPIRGGHDGRQTSVSRPRAGPARRPGGVRQDEESEGPRAEHLQAYGVPRPLRGAGRRVVRDAARGRARPQAAPARLREGLTDQWLQLLSDAQRGPRAEGRSAEGEVRCAGRLHDQPALLRSRAIGHPLCGGDDREDPGRFAARGRAQEAAGTGSPRAAHAQHRGRQLHQPLQRGARHGTGSLKQRRRWSMSRTIKFAKAGGPEVLEFIETRVPTPGPREVRINVKAIGINRAESMWRNDAYIEPVKFPAGLGYEAAGIVDAVGKGVTGFPAGQIVNVDPAFSMNQYFTYGEVILAPDYALAKHPKSLSFTAAAAIRKIVVTAYGALIEDAKVTKGDFVI